MAAHRTQPGTDIAVLATSFDLHLAGEGRSKRTRAIYGAAAKGLVEFLESNDHPTGVRLDRGIAFHRRT